MVVPPGAVNVAAVLTVSVPGRGGPPLPNARKPVTPVWDVLASSRSGRVTVFNRPLRLVVHYRQAAPAVIASWDGQEWVNMATRVDAGARTATATAPHLTLVVAFATATMVPEAPPPSGGFPLAPALFVTATQRADVKAARKAPVKAESKPEKPAVKTAAEPPPKPPAKPTTRTSAKAPDAPAPKAPRRSSPAGRKPGAGS